MAYGNGGELGIKPSYQAGTAAPSRQGMVSSQLERQMKVTESLHSLLSDLEVRLSGVTRPDAQTATEKAMLERQALVPIANGLYELNDKIDSACARVQSLLNRIEL